MDEYDKKFAEMQKYIPFLEAMIERLQNVKDKSREIQLQKMQSLHGILSNSKRKLRIETLQRCEDVLQKLHNKVEKGNTPGIQISNKKAETSSSQPSTSSEEANAKQQCKTVAQPEPRIQEKKMDETPASPSPPVSPETVPQLKPIIIPTERSAEYCDDKSSCSSPDQTETIATKAPIIIPTERKTSNDSPSPTKFGSGGSESGNDVVFSEWEMLEESEKQNNRSKGSWQPIVSGHDVAGAAKLVSSSLPQKMNDGRSHVPTTRHIPTVPVPSLGGSRRLSSVLEKNRLSGVSVDAINANPRPDSPVNVPDVRLQSPDPEILFPKPKGISPKSKDAHAQPKITAKTIPVPLLVSPPPVSTEPPLSIEDLAELLNEENDGSSEKKGDRTQDSSDQRKGVWERLGEDVTKSKKESGRSETSATGCSGTKDFKSSKGFLLSQDDIDKESERRWEEIDKHIVKFTTRKGLPNVASTSPVNTKAELLKSNEIKGPPGHQSVPPHGVPSSPRSGDKTADGRSLSSSPASKSEPRYADNYERHPRLPRDPYVHDHLKAMDKPSVRAPDDDPNAGHAGALKLDERNANLYQRRPSSSVGPDSLPPRLETDFRMDNPDYFNRQLGNQSHWPQSHPTPNANEFCNKKWAPPTGYPNAPHQSVQNPYHHPHGMPQDMWNVTSGPNPVPGELHGNQFPANINAGIRPLMSPTSRPQDMNHVARQDEMPSMNVSAIPSLISPTGFPVGSQYRGFPPENRSYDAPFDRPKEYPGVQPRLAWDLPTNRSNEWDGEIACGNIPSEGPAATAGSYPRTNTPCSWNRDRDRCNRGRGREGYYNDRRTADMRAGFNRDTRRTDWSRDSHEWDTSRNFNRDGRSISDRDPRVRADHNAPNSVSGPARDSAGTSASTSARDPRLAKDKHLPAGKPKDTSFERDPRKRLPPLMQTSFVKKTKEKPKLPKSPEAHRRDSDSGKQSGDKAHKDKMQSPLESLYGVIDTKGKTGQGYGLQKFKIPKIKRAEPPQSVPNSGSDEGKNAESSPEKNSTAKDEAAPEVTSSSDGPVFEENWDMNIFDAESAAALRAQESSKESVPTSSDVSSLRESVEEESKTEPKLSEADSVTSGPAKSPEDTETSQKESMELDVPKLKDEVTQEWIEALIRKSLECGEGKKLLEHAKLIQKIGEVLQAKKFKKIKKIIESESGSSSSDKDEIDEPRKVLTRKKRRVIVSDSSDDECLAERLGILNSSTNEEDPKEQLTADGNNKTVESDSRPADGPEENVDVSMKSDVSGKTESLESKEIEKADETAKPGALRDTPTPRQDVEDESKLEEDRAQKLPDDRQNDKNESSDDRDDANNTDAETAKCHDETEDKESSTKAAKPKAKRRNSLEMLQEDIREMFICEGVVTATGHRMCRLQKETVCGSSTSTSPSSANSSMAKKDEPLAASDKQLPDDSEESASAATRLKKGKEPVGKAKSKARKETRRITRQRSKEVASSSDSEEDQPLALRTELMFNLDASNTADDVAKSPKDEQHDTLRRSKRVLRKETIKEPRVVVEKTNISKIESSKVMFDSSSDESFGIDVSELAAAVDDSLHTEKQADDNAQDATESARRPRAQRAAKTRARKKSASLLTDDRNDDGGSFTDEGSFVSDMSRSSSVASGRKMRSSAAKTDAAAKEEYLSNILVGFIGSKGEKSGKDSPAADKESDADVDEDANDVATVDQSNKKVTTKKKKKKCIWQMGIVSKKKKKKVAPSTSSTNNDPEDTNVNKDDASSMENKALVNNEVSKASDMAQTSVEKKVEEKDVVTDGVSDPTENVESVSNSPNEKADVSSKRSVERDGRVSTLREQEQASEVSAKEERTEHKVEEEVNIMTETPATDVRKSSNDINEDPFENISVKRLIDYAWTGQDRYKCLLCFFTGKNIVHHYKLNHPGKEILISRLKSSDAHAAIQEARNGIAESNRSSENDQYKFNCRFCFFSTEGASSIAMEAFYEHCTTHTGEYRFQCKNCPYQSVAKSSMRTHYYKVCRKLNETFNEATSEDEIPKGDRIYGYVCSKCNFVQLKESNLRKHMDIWHRNEPDSEIVKINMSVYSAADTSPINLDYEGAEDTKVDVSCNDSSAKENSKPVVESDEQNDCKMEIDVKDSIVLNDTCLTVKKDLAGVSSELSSHNIIGNEVKDEVPIKDESLEKPKSSQSDSESVLSSGNLSVFVCPPELENKEVEIQLERKKKMQEIIENIGITLHKNASNKGPSITDKLKDIMETNQQPVNEESNTTELLDSSESCLASTTSLVVKEPEKESSNDDENVTDKMDSASLKTDADDVVKSDAKTADPLSAVSSQKANFESEIETSDNETTRESTAAYDSEDSSSEQSDSEQADVNMILKETSNINVSSKDPMMTTIQRLAAQLQAAKPLEATQGDGPRKTRTDKDKKSTTPRSAIPKPPNVVPISSIKRFFGKLDSTYQEIFSDSNDDAQPPKNFIRLRRLSGDMLSAPTQSSENSEDSTVPTVDANQPSEATGDILQTDTEEECSFLKIENVVSLAPSADNDGADSPIINDIRKAMETSPVKNRGVSILKKTSPPLILKRVNAVTISQPLTKKNIQAMHATKSDTVKLISIKPVPPQPTMSNYIPIVPKPTLVIPQTKGPTITSVASRTVPVAPSSNINYKILKVVRSSDIFKKDSAGQLMTAVKYKSSEAYSAMLNPVKLSHFYKCMSRDCRFTTDSPTSYLQHSYQHSNSPSAKNASSTKDYLKCAYCCTVQEDWNGLKSHMEDRHAHCRYQCNYCFYRAIVPSYVQIHQMTSHPGSHVGVLLGKILKEVPSKEEVNRHEFIHPYMCQQDCGKFFYVPESFIAHLKAKHQPVDAVFKCHVCNAASSKIDQLITHYKTHRYCKFQCLYCIHGADTFHEMHTHLSMSHCNRFPQVLERSLPKQIIKNRDVIDQLVIRTIDEGYRVTTDMIEVDHDASDDNKGTASKNVILPSNAPQSSSSKEGAVLEADKTESVGPTVTKILPKVDNSRKISSPDPRSVLNIACTESGKKNMVIANTITLPDKTDQTVELVLPYSQVESRSSLHEKSTESICPSLEQLLDKELDNASPYIFQDPDFELLACTNEDLNAVDPLGLADLNCSDEFININLLDNPDVLKTAKTHRSDITITNCQSLAEEKTEDSDIEILESIENTSSGKDRKADEIKTLNVNSSKSTDDSESSIRNNMIETSDASNEGASSSSVATKQDKLLTLEDIKDTGFTGPKLYRCGYDTCDYGAATAALLKSHIRECTLADEAKTVFCAHCSKRFLKIGFLLEHLKLHGLKRFGCSLCKMRCAVSYQAMAHMKAKHKFANSKLVPADPTNPSADGLFVVQPVRPLGERRGKKRRSAKFSEKDSDKSMDMEKLSFSPDEIELLPRQAIYNREVQCAVCPYTTKVRTNIVRHLQLHAKDETVPETGPVNPVPCLDKKERMFDKMVNLASSSHQNGRMGGKPKDPVKDIEEGTIPKFVPEHKRYVCGVAECNYLTVDEAMLRYHLKALHSEEPYFRCPHCPAPVPGQEGQNIAIDKMGIHLKMHDARLYKCSHCNHHHYHRHIVERHLTDKHPEKRPFVKVIRELETTDNVPQVIQEETEEEVPDPDGNHWKCNVCDHKCVYKAEMAAHASNTHDEKYQYKCTSCTFKTSGKILFEQHISSKHVGESAADFILVYQRIKGVNKKSSESVEQVSQEEPFDTTPLWRRDMPRIRHIRGILLEEEDETANSDSSLKSTKRKSDVEIGPVKPAKIKSGKSASLDENKQSKEKSKRSLSCEKICAGAEGYNQSEGNDSTPQKKEGGSENVKKFGKDLKARVAMAELSDINDTDVGKFGPYGKPQGNMYVCTLCTQFKSKYKHDMRDHIYRELNYARWHCKDCGFLSVNRNALLKHFTRHHPGERPEHEPLSPDDAIEEWVATLLKRQTNIMRGLPINHNINTSSFAANASNAACTGNTKPATARSFETALEKATKTAKTTKTVDLAHTITSLQNDSIQDTSIEINTDDDEDSRDNEDLIIDIKEDSKNDLKDIVTEDKKPASTATPEDKKPLICKHCGMKFARCRGFKLHVQLTHLKRLGYVCPYCDRSTNSESLMRQHIRRKHRGCAETLVRNPSAGGPDLSDDFWEKEYGVAPTKKSTKKRKRPAIDDESPKERQEETTHEVCGVCGFTAINTTGLKAHMRVHACKNNLRCAHCTFAGSMKAELFEHWEVNHPHLPFQFEDTATGIMETNVQGKSRGAVDYNDDIEEERDCGNGNPPEVKRKLIYMCFYCPLRYSTLDGTKRHWSAVHKESAASGDASKPTAGQPFRFREVYVPVTRPRGASSPEKLPKLASSAQSVAEASTTGGASDAAEGGWYCQWCNEFCDSDGSMRTHQNMFHSHLPVHFKGRDGEEVRNSYACSECRFETMFAGTMKKHVVKHIDLFKCKYCEEAFASPGRVAAHNAEAHPAAEFKIESIKNYEELVERMMTRIMWGGATAERPRDASEREGTAATPRKKRAVARKSTTRSSVCLNPAVRKVKAVARKSTSPLPRYPLDARFRAEPAARPVSRQFSHYGIPSSPVNLGKLNTYMVVGGHRMKVNCTTLAQLININPKIVLTDVKHDVENSAVFSNRK